MYKSYQPTLPASNRLLKKKWDDKYYSEHRILVRDARPSIDTRPPRTYMHLHMKLKKLQLEEERAATIERDNRILLEKMSTIMRTTGRIDNRNDYQSKSLNHEKRRRELLRVARENSTMLQRISHRKPDMDTQKWKNSSSQNNAYLNNISKYKPDWYKPKSARRLDGITPQRSDDHRTTRSADNSPGRATADATPDRHKSRTRTPSASRDQPKSAKGSVNNAAQRDEPTVSTT